MEVTEVFSVFNVSRRKNNNKNILKVTQVTIKFDVWKHIPSKEGDKQIKELSVPLFNHKPTKKKIRLMLYNMHFSEYYSTVRFLYSSLV